MTLACFHPFIDNKAKVVFMMALCSVLQTDQFILLKGSLSVYVNMFFRTERQDGEEADERVFIPCVEKKHQIFFFAG